MNLQGASNVLEFLSDLGHTLIDAYSTIFNWFTYTVYLPNFGEVSVFAMIFSYGLSWFLTVSVLKFIIDL